MAIGLKDIESSKQISKKSLFDLILERKEQRFHEPESREQESIQDKKRVLRPWESFHSTCQPEVLILSEEQMLKRIKERAEELFKNIDFF